jgi:hypothetical protein
VSAPRPFKHGVYHPGEWRRRVGFGTGTLGDMGCHIYSPPYRALKLTSPVSVTAYGPSPSEESWATKARVKLTYPGTEYTAGSTVDIWWYDGGELPPDAIREAHRPPLSGPGQRRRRHRRSARAAAWQHAGVRAARVEDALDAAERRAGARSLSRVRGRRAGRGKDKCSANFDYAGPLTESVIIGNVAAHFPGETLEFDAKALAFPRKREANQYLTRSYPERLGHESVVRGLAAVKWTILATLLVVFGASAASAQSRTLRWTRLAVTAHLDADGRLHVEERHSIVFDGDWNGGERVFRPSMENVIHLERISRIDESGAAVPLRENKEMTAVDEYGWTSSQTLRWRSRLPSDPSFEHREITYVLDYTDSNILIPGDDGSYLLDHHFGLPALEWPIDALSVTCRSIRSGRAGNWCRRTSRGMNAPHGENVTVTANLRHTGATRPAGVNFGAPAWLRVALLALLLGGRASMASSSCSARRASKAGALADPASIGRAWL